MLFFFYGVLTPIRYRDDQSSECSFSFKNHATLEFTQLYQSTVYRLYTCLRAHAPRWYRLVARTESLTERKCEQWICMGKERPHQNDARINGTCQMRPGRQARARKITVRWVAWWPWITKGSRCAGALHASVRDSSAQQAHLQLAALPPAVSAVVLATGRS